MLRQDEIVSYIVQENILQQQVLDEILQQQRASGQSLISILKKSELVNEEQFTKILAASNKIEFINLSADMVDPMAAHLVSQDMANQHNLIPLRKEGDKLLVAMSCPLNLAVRDQIEMKTGLKVVALAATTEAVKQAVRYHFNVQNVTRQAIASMRLKEDAGKNILKSNKRTSGALQVANDPVTKLVWSIITGAIDAKASDIHIEPQPSDTRIRYRIDGLLREQISVPSSVQQGAVSHIKIMADMDISEKRSPQDGHITVKHDGRDYDLRISSLPAIGGEKIVIRILDKSTSKWTLDDVVTCPDDNEKFRALVKNPYGMILLTGPTGSGKTTTLYSVLQLLNTPEKNIVTVEDPVEYQLEGITQVQVKPVAGMTFASALRSILRQDPDIILVGEIRDLETAEIAISSALTGHLVLSTMHTNDAVGAISRLINLGIPPFLVASGLLGTVAQRLIRTVCDKCKEAYTPTEEELRELSVAAQQSSNTTLYKSIGCNSCYESGYRGRKAIYEILCVSNQIRKMIVQSSSNDEIKEQAIKEGMKTLQRSGIEQVLDGSTDFKELLRVIDMRA